LNGLSDYYKKASHKTKEKIIGSIFPEKLEFDGESYRTTRRNAVLDLICSIDKGFETKQPDKCARLSALAPQTGLEPVTL